MEFRMMQIDPKLNTYTDLSGLSDLKRQARDDPDQALRQVAQQFEAIFLQMVLKSMRQANYGDPLFGSNQSEFYQEMFDQQVALSMANSKGTGLADLLVVQLQQGKRSTPSITEQRPQAIRRTTGMIQPTTFHSEVTFVETIWPMAADAADKLHTKPEVLIAQAALETGWGRAIQRHPDGKSSFNLFNIKADQRWDGEKVVANTLEFKDGIAQWQKAWFRSYDSYKESFRDYIDFLKSNPRYSMALAKAGDSNEFARQLSKAGYATDPDYSNKMIRVMENKAIKDRSTEYESNLKVEEQRNAAIDNFQRIGPRG